MAKNHSGEEHVTPNNGGAVAEGQSARFPCPPSIIARDRAAYVSVVICNIEHSYSIGSSHAEALVEILDGLDREKKTFAKAACEPRGRKSTRRVGFAGTPHKRSGHYGKP
jgi:hypothetical protein